MKISVFGLGYVGAVSAGCLTAFGHKVVGVDPIAAKVDLVNRGKSPVVENGLADLIAKAVQVGHLRATQDGAEAVLSTDMSLVCVGTPSKSNGDLDLVHIADVSREIGEAIGKKVDRHTVVIRSTVLPGTVRGLVIPLLERFSGKHAGIDFGVGNNPEFLREGTAVADFLDPPKAIVGAIDEQTTEDIVSIYKALRTVVFRTSIEVGEMVKYVDNVWHALKVAYANEVGSACKAMSIDSHTVMDIFCQDSKLNLSPYYLKPGFAFGGSCLPKDVRALTYRGRSLDLDLPVMNSILLSNERQITRGFDLIAARGKRRISILGVSFKAGTDDLRESPVLNLVERLTRKGYDVRIFDRNVNLSKLVGANREFLLKSIPHVSSLLVSTLEEALSHGETVVVGTSDPEFLRVGRHLRPDQYLIDLARIESREQLEGRYDGINW